MLTSFRTDVDDDLVGEWGIVRNPRDDVAAVARLLDAREVDVLVSLRCGTTLAAFANRRGVDTKYVVDAVVADRERDLAARVEAGEITPAQAARVRTVMMSSVVDLVYFGLPV